MNMRNPFFHFSCMVLATVFGLSRPAYGIQLSSELQVTNQVESMDIITGSSQRLKFAYDVPELQVENPEVIQATPISTDEIMITGLKPGISTLTISDAHRKLQTININVVVDTRPVQQALAKHFPDSQIRVDALQTGIIVSGFVARPDQVENAMLVARDYFPTNAIDQLRVQGTQNIAIKVKIFEVSRSKLRQLGVDWSAIGPNGGVVSSVSDLIQQFSLQDGSVAAVGQNITSGVFSNGSSFNLFIDALEQRNVAKLLDEPTLVSQNGRPAEFLSGGEVPIQVASGLGTNSIEFRPFGTKLDIVPIVHGQGQLTLEVRAEVSELANELAGDTGVPGFRVRRVNTGVKMRAGHTLALAGDYRENSQGQVRGVPKIMDTPFLGTMFRKINENTNETELVFLITPMFVTDIEPQMVQTLAPGQLTARPSDRELFLNGHLEIPRCNDDCPIYDRVGNSVGQQSQQFVPLNSNQGMEVPMGQKPGSNAPQLGPSNGPTYESSAVQPARRGNFGQPARQANESSGFNWPGSTKHR